MVESGLPGFESNTWFALIVASKTPPGVLQKIQKDIAHAMKSPTVLKRINEIKSMPVGNTAEEFRKVIASDYAIFKRVIENVK